MSTSRAEPGFVRRGAGELAACLHAALDLVVPATCAGCDAPARLLCARCASLLDAPVRWSRPDPCPPGLPEVASVAGYAGPVGAAVVAHKDEGRLALAAPLGDALARSVAAVLTVAAYGPVDRAGAVGPVALVPVPSSRAAVRRRGHDPLRRVSARAVRRLRTAGVDVRLVPVLRQRRRVADQAGLAAAERAANLRGSLHVPAQLAARVQGRAVVLVDDVVTTGATLAEALAALRRAGVEPAGVATIAATERRTPRRQGLRTGKPG